MQHPNRRTVLSLLASGPLMAAAGGALMAGGAWAAGEQKIARLIREARVYPTVSQRIDAISRALMGTKYVAHTLVGGARQHEVFVVRDDGFDCVTFCELVFAAAIGPDLAGFEEALRQIRYHNGNVDWHQRNHYFADWCARNIENRFCRVVTIGTPVRVHKIVDSEPAVGRREWTLHAITKDTLLANVRRFATGDIVGFVSSQPNLDYFHCSFIVIGPQGELLLRHASQSHGRVIQERAADFFAANGNKLVTVVRPEEPAARSMSQAG